MLLADTQVSLNIACAVKPRRAGQQSTRFNFLESEPWINILNIREEKMKLNRRDVLVLVGSAATAILVGGRAQSATVETYYYLVFNNPSRRQ